MLEKDDLFIDRELSWLEFNQRVLEEAKAHAIPLLERLKFLAITGSNLDEFFMVRVGGLRMLQKSGGKVQPASKPPSNLLHAIAKRVRALVAQQYECYLESLEPALERNGIMRLQPDQLEQKQTRYLEKIFEHEIFPVLTPMTVSLEDEFPLLVNQALNLCIRFKIHDHADRSNFAVIPLGRNTERFITLPAGGGYAYMLLEDLVTMFIQQYFPERQIMECVPFRITRNADITLQDEWASNLLAEMESILAARRESACVRVELSDQVTKTMRQFLQRALKVDPGDLHAVPGPLFLSSFMKLTDLKGYEHLKYPVWTPQASPRIDPTRSMFETIRKHDLLLHHPYESFDPVLRLIEEAANDPGVLAIKQILYRTSGNSPIITALMRAAENGKYVTVIVELKARFDEARNIAWARALEHAGVQVIYGIKGLKTHAKLCVVVRKEKNGIRRYVHFGTGNYNETTARLYSDISFFTAKNDFGTDAISFFHAITGYSQSYRLMKLAAAPIGLREKLIEMIEAEMERKRQGQKARIMGKLNALVDERVIQALYRASRAGVAIKLQVRGICCLRPGIPGVSDNITVTSTIDRFLEHARIFYFLHGGDERVYLSSADWMPRNLDRRIELFIPIEDGECRQRLIEILQISLRDTGKTHKLLANGRYQRVKPQKNRPAVRSQEVFYGQSLEAMHEFDQMQKKIFAPHLPSNRNQA